MYRHRRRHSRWLFFRFAAIFGVLGMLLLAGMAVIALLLVRYLGGDGSMAVLVWIGGCGLALALPLLALAVASWAFRVFAQPLSDLMAAAERVADGDLSVRVTEHGPGDFRRFIRSFNRMVEELAGADERRKKLTADVAHELRTPLHIIQGNLEGMIDGVYEADAGHIEATLVETRALARLVDDLQTLSMAEAGQLPMSWEEIDVWELLTDVQTSFSGQSEAAGITLQVQTGSGEPYHAGTTPPLVIKGDYGRLNQVFTNLVANAIRHTPAEGMIILQAESKEEHISLRVVDTGEGIPPDQLPYVFDRFWRGDPARSHATGTGSGLGLAIAQQLVRAHGGRIGVESVLGQGSVFEIELPGRLLT